VRVVLDRRAAPITSLAGAYTASRKFFVKHNRSTSLIYSVNVGLSVLFAVLFCVAWDATFRIATGLTTAGLVFQLYRSHVYRSLATPQPVALKDSALHYRSELERDIESTFGWMGWLNFAFLLSGLLVLLYENDVQVFGPISLADCLADKSLVHTVLFAGFAFWSFNSVLLIFSSLLFICVRMKLRERHRQIAELDALLTESGEASTL
jgi:hypothetical protein